jgi:tellurite resistance protein TerC
MDVPFWAWAAVLGVILAMLAVDLFAHRREHVVSLREAALWSVLWVGLGLGFGAVVWAGYGAQAGGEYFAGYLIEKSLAVDNVFVFALIFGYFAVPRQYQHRVLFYGVLGALVFRAVFIAGGAALLEQFHWILYVFGAFLVVTGWRMFRHRNEETDPGRNPVLRVVRRFVPTTDELHGQRFWVRKAGKWVATPLFTVLVLVETSDIIFAVDSIPAIFAVTQEPFLVFTSNAFAILGLRAMYFLLADLIHRFVYLKVGLAAILVFVGVKMLLLDVYKIPITLALAVIGVMLTVSVVASLRATRETSSTLEGAAKVDKEGVER